MNNGSLGDFQWLHCDHEARTECRVCVQKWADEQLDYERSSSRLNMLREIKDQVLAECRYLETDVNDVTMLTDLFSRIEADEMSKLTSAE